MRKDLDSGHLAGRGAFGSPACRPGAVGPTCSPLNTTPRMKQQNGTPVSSVRRAALQQSSAANSPIRPPSATRPNNTSGARAVGGYSEVMESHIKVYVRTRPPGTINGATCVDADPEGSTIAVQTHGAADVKATPRSKGRSEDAHSGVDNFVFEDGVLHPDVSQEEVFNMIGRPAAEAVLDGYNVTVFAYGQTGAGKTHSIYGRGGQCDEATENPQAGLTDRIMKHLISTGASETQTLTGISYRYAVSMLDIYDDSLHSKKSNVTDLFEPGHEKQVRQGPKGKQLSVSD